MYAVDRPHGTLAAGTVITVLACAQKLLPPKAAIDMPLALAIIGLGSWIVIAPALVPGLVPSM
jgi:hypothetical protein